MSKESGRKNWWKRWYSKCKGFEVEMNLGLSNSNEVIMVVL